MTRKLGLLLALIMVSCVGNTDPADNITATSARLKAHGTCSTGKCSFYFELGKCTLVFGGSPVCNYTARQSWTNVVVPAGVEYPIAHRATGLEPGSRYRFRICGKEDSEVNYTCGTPREFDTGRSEAAPPSVKYARGSIQKAGYLSHAANSTQGRDVGAAVKLGGRLVWFFGDVALTVAGEDGRNWRTSTAAQGPAGFFRGNYPALDDATASSEHHDANGAPKQFVPYTGTEPEFIGSQWYYHWPISGFTRTINGQEEALIFFSRGVFHSEGPQVTYVDKLVGGVQTAGTTGRFKMWDQAQSHGDRYFPVDVEEGGYRYFVSSKRTASGFVSRLFLARVPPLQATDPRAYRYWNAATRRWQTDQISTACLLDSCPVEGMIEVNPFGDYNTSISYNPYLKQYLLVAGNGTGAELYVANNLTGPWSAGTTIPATEAGDYGFLDPTATKGLPNYHARENVHLRSSDGKTIVLTYLHAVDAGLANRAIKLLKLSLER